MKLSVRALDPQVRALLKVRIHELVQQQAASFRVQAHIDWQDGYAVLVNDEACTTLASQLAVRLFGHTRVTPQGAPITASEDFAFMLQRVPGCYFFVGNGAAGTPGGCMVHNPGYDFNDDLIADGATFWSALVSEYLSPGAT
jgi:hippurate hydrolase